MDVDDINRFLERAIPDDEPEEARERFRDLRKNLPEEGNAAETTIRDIDPTTEQSLFYEFDLGDGWEHQTELQETHEGSLDGDPAVVNEQGEAPPQYPGREE